MEISEIPVDGYEKVLRAKDQASGLHAIIAVHDTTLGPALGGMRLWPYANEDEALTDVLRLSRGMTFKSAMAHTGLGGGKSVIIGSPEIKSRELFLAMGSFVDSLKGQYITAEDVNIKIADLEIVREVTPYVTGLSKGSGSSGNPSPYTARGCFLGIKACVARAFGSESLDGKKVAILGCGSVGSKLVRFLHKSGAKVWAYDIKPERVQKLVDEKIAVAASEEEAMQMDADVFSPCALGAILNDDSIPKLRCKIVAGAANNQLHAPEHGDQLKSLGILYAPDYVINAGGIINVACELLPGGYNEQASLERIRRIPAALNEVFDLAEERDISTARAARLRAEQIIEAGHAS